MNAEVLNDFFAILIRDAERKMHLIVDNLKVHCSCRVKA